MLTIDSVIFGRTTVPTALVSTALPWTVTVSSLVYDWLVGGLAGG